MCMTVRDLATVQRVRGTGIGPMSLDIRAQGSWCLSTITATFPSGADSVDFILYRVPEFAGLDPVLLLTIPNVGGGGNPVFMRVTDAELRHWLFIGNPDAPTDGDALRITWAGTAGAPIQWSVDVMPLPSHVGDRG